MLVLLVEFMKLDYFWKQRNIIDCVKGKTKETCKLINIIRAIYNKVKKNKHRENNFIILPVCIAYILYRS